MTITPPPARVPFLVRTQFEDRIRHAVNRLHLEARGQAVCADAVCQAAHDVSRLYLWVTLDDVAAALADQLGTGWGATYRQWHHGVFGVRP